MINTRVTEFFMSTKPDILKKTVVLLRKTEMGIFSVIEEYIKQRDTFLQNLAEGKNLKTISLVQH